MTTSCGSAPATKPNTIVIHFRIAGMAAIRNGTTMNVAFCGRIANASPAATPAARNSLRVEASTISAQAAALTACAIRASRVEYHISDDPNQMPRVAVKEAQGGAYFRATMYPARRTISPQIALAETAATLYGREIPSAAKRCNCGTTARRTSAAMNAGYQTTALPAVQWSARWPLDVSPSDAIQPSGSIPKCCHSLKSSKS